MADYKFDTLSLHAGQSPDARFGSRAVPIHQTTSYVFDSTEHAAALFNMEVGGHIYSRLTNPTVAVLEQRLAALDGGVAAVATASGMSALFVTVLALCSAGDHIVSSSQMYGANINLFEHTLKRYGIETSFVAPNDPAAIAEAIRPNTKMVFGEVIGNPGMDIMDVPAGPKLPRLRAFLWSSTPRLTPLGWSNQSNWAQMWSSIRSPNGWAAMALLWVVR